MQVVNCMPDGVTDGMTEGMTDGVTEGVTDYVVMDGVILPFSCDDDIQVVIV